MVIHISVLFISYFNYNNYKNIILIILLDLHYAFTFFYIQQVHFSEMVALLQAINEDSGCNNFSRYLSCLWYFWEWDMVGMSAASTWSKWSCFWVAPLLSLSDPHENLRQFLFDLRVISCTVLEITVLSAFLFNVTIIWLGGFVAGCPTLRRQMCYY